MSSELLGLRPDHTYRLDLLRLDNPGDGRDVVRNAAVNLALETFDDLRPADLPPLFGGGHFLACIRLEDLRKHRIGIGLALIVIGSVRAALVCIKGMPDGFDTQLVKHVLVILLGSESDWLLRIGRCAEQAAGD